VLAYGFPNRLSVGGRSESQIMKGLDPGPALGTVEEAGNGSVTFLDVTRGDVRARMMERFKAAKQQLGVDGFALDLSVRTPVQWPGVLAKQCARAADFCPRYAAGMDAVFEDLQAALGPGAFIAYNGLFNTRAGQLDDQAKLLAHANAAAVEFFGLDPKEEKHSFSEDILPYLKIAQKLPANKPLLFFGRGSWKYTSYLRDYEWQRYLYASYLLIKRAGDAFKYHATFQAPTRKGRTGGIDVYADWDVDLGNPAGPM
jgi:hypothetical protein